MRRFVQRLLIYTLTVSLSGVAQAYNPYSTKELDNLEKEFMQLINQSSLIVRNPLANQYVNHLAKQLTQSTQGKTPFIFIVQSDEINAFAGPGGNIGINTQLITTSDTESELAAVMAHEIAHVRLNHLYRLIQHEKQMQIPMLAALLAATALSLLNPTLASGAMMASLSGVAQDKINFTRSNEKEADRIGIKMLTNAGFDPHGMVNFFKKMQQSMRYYYTDNIPAILRTHPLDEDRIAEALNRINASQKRQYQTNMDYYLFRELIRNHARQHNKPLLDYYQKECSKHAPQDACQFGQALAYMRSNQLDKAAILLEQLVEKNRFNLFYQITLAQVESAKKQHEAALSRLENLHQHFPDSYAVLMAYAEALLQAGRPQQTTSLLIKGFRQFKRDLTLCETLAQAQAENKQQAYAYFTQAQCYLLQGEGREALRQLKVAQKLSQNDAYLSARVDAMIDEVKFHLEK